jgi:hypothetical protein
VGHTKVRCKEPLKEEDEVAGDGGFDNAGFDNGGFQDPPETVASAGGDEIWGASNGEVADSGW